MKMKIYHVHCGGQDGEELFSVTDHKGAIVIQPCYGASDFICTLVEELLLPEREPVNFFCDEAVPDYHARIIELFEKLYNLIPEESKPVTQ